MGHRTFSAVSTEGDKGNGSFFAGCPTRAQVRIARCRLGERGGTYFAEVFERPDLRDELCELGRAEAGFGVRSAWAALAGGRVGEAANAGRPQHSAADVVCVDWPPVVAYTHKSRLAR